MLLAVQIYVVAASMNYSMLGGPFSGGHRLVASAGRWRTICECGREQHGWQGHGEQGEPVPRLQLRMHVAQDALLCALRQEARAARPQMRPQGVCRPGRRRHERHSRGANC